MIATANLPLYIVCGRDLLAAKLRPANIDAAAGSVEEVARIVAQIRTQWPNTRITLRADSGFARDALMAWCEAHAVDYIFGLARNKRLVDTIAVELAAARQESRHIGRPARQFKDFTWRTRKSWSRTARRQWPPSLRKNLLRPRRDGEPHQGMSDRPVR
jgi:hypothetical protein